MPTWWLCPRARASRASNFALYSRSDAVVVRSKKGPSSPLCMCGAIAMASSVLACPQLHDDEFRVDRQVASTGGGAGSNPGAQGGTGGERGGSGGSSGGADIGDSGATPPYIDDCPNGPDATVADPCACGSPDTPTCALLAAALVHRYRFGGNGNRAIDSVGGADASLVNVELQGAEALDLAGGTTDQYADLPNGIVSSLGDATFEVWLTWAGGASWQRIFDFGTTQQGEDVRGNASSYLFLTPRANPDGRGSQDFLRVTYTADGLASEVNVEASRALPVGSLEHVAVVVDDQNDELRLYLGGALQATKLLTGSLAAIQDNNNWLGRSQYVQDPGLAARLLEFRIYSAALGENELGVSFRAGPDAVLVKP
jgi:hypothetical protein